MLQTAPLGPLGLTSVIESHCKQSKKMSFFRKYLLNSKVWQLLRMILKFGLHFMLNFLLLIPAQHNKSGDSLSSLASKESATDPTARVASHHGIWNMFSYLFESSPPHWILQTATSSWYRSCKPQSLVKYDFMSSTRDVIFYAEVCFWQGHQ